MLLHQEHKVINCLTGVFLLVCCVFILSSCASSQVSRDVASGIDLGTENARNLADSASSGSIADSYQNSSQAFKGAIIGGAAGALTGALYSSVGVVPGVAVGAILGASYGSYIDSLTTHKDKLENRGVNIVVLGDQILIVIPSARLFEPDTSTLKPDAYSTLAMVSAYINKYTKMLVRVSGYTDDTGVCDVDLALSQQQAERVAKTLSSTGVDARVLYAAGYGGTKLVEPNTMNWDSDNYRIEITLEKLDV